MDDELRQYLDRFRQENMKAHLETWRQLAALERRTADDSAASHAETRLHIDAAVERLERLFGLVGPDTEVHFRHDG